LLLVLGLALPGFGLLLALAMFVWALAASIPAAEETLEIDMLSALLSAMTGWLAMFALARALPLMTVCAEASAKYTRPRVGDRRWLYPCRPVRTCGSYVRPLVGPGTLRR
jgi:hypothetical protein